MTVALNHTIVWCTDKARSARFLTELLGLPEPEPFGPFLVVELANGVSMDYHEAEGPIASQHYAFLITEVEFDSIFSRLRAQDLDFWADPACRHLGQINFSDGGRGVYFNDPDGHLLEIITRPYASSAT